LVMLHLKACGGELSISHNGGNHSIKFEDVSHFQDIFDSLEIMMIVKRTAKGGGVVGFFITKECPMTFVFALNTGKLTVSFFVQGYNQFGFPMCVFPKPSKK
jgi:hypothetical protein